MPACDAGSLTMSPVDIRILDEASQWLARRNASDFSDAEHAALARWRSQSARHEQVWLRAEELRRRMEAVPTAIGMSVLNRSKRAEHRRQALRMVALALITPTVGWLSYRHLPWQIWRADYRTAKGETRVLTLADSSRVLLNTASAISAGISTDARWIRQYAGEIQVETSHSFGYAERPFIVQTEDGQMRALGTRFIVRKYERSTRLSVLQGSVQVTPTHATESIVVRATEQLQFDSRDIGTVAPLSPQANAWVQGVLYADNMQLKDFLLELSRYRDGLLLCDPSASSLRVTGVFQLRDTDRILELLAQTLPVHVLERSRYWVTVTHA